ncbi:hypothetical protein COE51_01235 [Bacillus pseudomycoides]|nr:hypothetical protein COE51_01235 [Bacillus pseudomycoides]
MGKKISESSPEKKLTDFMNDNNLSIRNVRQILECLNDAELKYIGADKEDKVYVWVKGEE